MSRAAMGKRLRRYPLELASLLSGARESVDVHGRPLSQQMLANALQVARQTVERWESGVTKPPVGQLKKYLEKLVARGLPAERGQEILSTIYPEFDGYLTMQRRRVSEVAIGYTADEVQRPFKESFVHPLVRKALLHDEDAEAFRLSKDLDYDQAPSFGRIFQIRNWILPHTQLAENGLAPSEIAIDPPLEAFSNFETSIVDGATVDRLIARREFDGKKVSLVGLLPRQDVSDENLGAVRLITAESTYFLNMGALTTIKNNRLLRHQNMSLDPESHTIPNAISIHYIIRFLDRKFLANHRAKTMAYDPERISFTGNEQLKPEDFIDDRPLDRWLFRSLLEEVFRLRKFAPESPEALTAKSQIAFGRFLSLYLEEKVGNFGLVCFVH